MSLVALPTEICDAIFDYLGLAEVCQVALVCHALRLRTGRRRFQKLVLQGTYGELHPSIRALLQSFIAVPELALCVEDIHIHVDATTCWREATTEHKEDILKLVADYAAKDGAESDAARVSFQTLTQIQKCLQLQQTCIYGVLIFMLRLCCNLRQLGMDSSLLHVLQTSADWEGPTPHPDIHKGLVMAICSLDNLIHVDLGGGKWGTAVVDAGSEVLAALFSLPNLRRLQVSLHGDIADSASPFQSCPSLRSLVIKRAALSAQAIDRVLAATPNLVRLVLNIARDSTGDYRGGSPELLDWTAIGDSLRMRLASGSQPSPLTTLCLLGGFFPVTDLPFGAVLPDNESWIRRDAMCGDIGSLRSFPNLERLEISSLALPEAWSKDAALMDTLPAKLLELRVDTIFDNHRIFADEMACMFEALPPYIQAMPISTTNSLVSLTLTRPERGSSRLDDTIIQLKVLCESLGIVLVDQVEHAYMFFTPG